MKPLQCVLVAAVMLSGCERKRRPWEGNPDGRVVSESRPFLPGSVRPPREGSWLPGLSSALAEPSASDGSDGQAGPNDDLAKPPQAIAKGGGLWRSCAAKFSPSSTPRRDVERLAALCGPPNGMEPVGEALEGIASSTTVVHALPVKRGACYRVFAIGEASIEGLNVTVVSVRGSRLAGVDDAGRVVMVEAERPFCSFATETVNLELSARAGKGHYALRVFELRAS